MLLAIKQQRISQKFKEYSYILILLEIFNKYATAQSQILEEIFQIRPERPVEHFLNFRYFYNEGLHFRWSS